jgi:hypothetical protein
MQNAINNVSNTSSLAVAAACGATASPLPDVGRSRCGRRCNRGVQTFREMFIGSPPRPPQLPPLWPLQPLTSFSKRTTIHRASPPSHRHHHQPPPSALCLPPPFFPRATLSPLALHTRRRALRRPRHQVHRICPRCLVLTGRKRHAARRRRPGTGGRRPVTSAAWCCLVGTPSSATSGTSTPMLPLPCHASPAIRCSSLRRP